MEHVTHVGRFWAIIVGQLIGVLLVFFVGVLPFISYGGIDKKDVRKNIKSGLIIIGVVNVIIFLALVVGFIIVFLNAKQPGVIEEKSVDRMLIFFICVDLLGLLFIVCQQGGLSRSMFLPVFFLIPAAYLAVVNPSKMNSAYVIIFSVALCVIISFPISYFKLDKLKLLIFRIKITDFDELYPKAYNWGFLVVCGASLLVPALQLFIQNWLATESF